MRDRDREKGDGEESKGEGYRDRYIDIEREEERKTDGQIICKPQANFG